MALFRTRSILVIDDEDEYPTITGNGISEKNTVYKRKSLKRLPYILCYFDVDLAIALFMRLSTFEIEEKHFPLPELTNTNV